MTWTFLVVDGDPAERDQSVRHLRSVQPAAEILTAASGREALLLLEEQRLVPSLILAEFSMDGMAGLEMRAAVRQTRWLARAPIAILSRPIPDRQVVTCYRLGACAVLTKPGKVFELREVLRDFAQPAVRMGAATIVASTGDGTRGAAA